MNDKMDLSQAEGVALLISARSQRSLNAARRQLMGALGERVRNFCDRLMDISALIEAYIDFPEDDLPPEDKSRVASEAEKLSCEIQALIDSSRAEYCNSRRAKRRKIVAHERAARPQPRHS